MKKRGIFFVTLLFLMALALAGIGYSATTSVTPTTGQTINGSAYKLNTTCGLSNVINVTWSMTANHNFAYSLNSTSVSNQTSFQNTTDTTALTEAYQSTMTISCWNSSNYAENQTLTITVDNTAPTAVLVLSHTNPVFHGPFDLDCSQSSDGVGIANYSGKIIFQQGTVEHSKNQTSARITFDHNELDRIGNANITCTVYDYAGQQSTTSEIKVLVKNRDGTQATKTVAIATAQEQVVKSKMQNTTLYVIITLVAIIVIMFFWTKPKKKK